MKTFAIIYNNEILLRKPGSCISDCTSLRAKQRVAAVNSGKGSGWAAEWGENGMGDGRAACDGGGWMHGVT